MNILDVREGKDEILVTAENDAAARKVAHHLKQAMSFAVVSFVSEERANFLNQRWHDHPNISIPSPAAARWGALTVEPKVEQDSGSTGVKSTLYKALLVSLVKDTSQA